MKKIFISFVLALAALFTATVVFAEYPRYLNGNSNYILCYGREGVGYYADASSMKSEVYNPPHYQISIDVVNVPDADRGNTTIQGRNHFLFYYNINEHSMHYMTNKGNWYRLSFKGLAWEGRYIQVGEIAFQLAYGMRFGAR